jgi:hypothetical protein
MFIYKKENALSLELCNSFIAAFEQSDDKHPGVISNEEGIVVDNSIKSSTDIALHPGLMKNKIWEPLLTPLINTLRQELDTYYNRFYEGLSTLEPLDVSSIFNIQRYLPNEGFPKLHCERATSPHFHRALVWMVYLNTVTDRGETEFYYQHHFETPLQGKLLIWPSDWTYLHRGVSSPTQIKYILTGWFVHNKE